MNNRIDASIEFSFQGESYHPSTTIDLDAMMASNGKLPDLYRYLAQQHHIDTYSYLYEVMESHAIHYSNASGLAAQCLQDGRFDLHGFERLWHEARELSALAGIAREQLGIAELEQEPAIKQALLQAYHLGKSAS